jgi:hypothetical protein
MRFIWSNRLFHLTLRLYPAQHRADYGEVMAQHFRDVCRAAYQREGRRGLITVWFKLMTDTFRNAPIEQWTAIRMGGIMRNKTLLMIGLALLGSLVVGTIDSHASEVQATLMVMLPITFALGFIQPKRAWLWALIIGLSVPFGYLWLLATGQHYNAPPSNGFTTLIALVPAFIGTYCGVILRKIFSQAATPT